MTSSRGNSADFTIIYHYDDLAAAGVGGVIKNVDVAEACSDIDFSKIDDIPKGTGKPNQIHHFLTNKSKKYAPEFKKITDKYGLDLDEWWNKKSLPHQGRHPYDYHEYMLEKVREYDNISNGDKELFLELFEEVKQEIIDNPDMLYKKYWRK